MAELLLHGVEGGRELRVHLSRELLDERLEVVDGLLQVAPLLAQEGGALRELGALRLGERVDRADALAAPREALDALPERGQLGLVGRRREPRLVELLAHLVETRRELGAPVLEARERHLDLRAALAGALELAPQLRLLVGEPAQLPALEAGALLVADVELGDEARGVRPQGAGARLHRRAGGAHIRESRKTQVELLEARAVRRGAAAGRLALRGGPLGGRAALLELDAPPRDQGERGGVRALGLAQRRLGVVGAGPELLGRDQCVRGCGIGRLLAGGGLRELRGDALQRRAGRAAGAPRGRVDGSAPG